MFLPKKARLTIRKGYLAPPVIIVLALITLAVAATLLFQAKFFSAGKTPSPSPAAQPSPIASPSTTPDEIANWKTYTNVFYGYKLSYPSTAIISEEMKPLGWTGKPEQVTTLNFKDGSLEITGNMGGRGVTSIKSSEIVIDNVPTIKFYETEISGVIRAVKSPKNDEIYFIFTLPSQNSERVNKILDQILSTFQFLD